MNIGVSEPDQFLDGVEAVLANDRPVGEEKASLQILGIDEIRHMIDHRFQ